MPQAEPLPSRSAATDPRPLVDAHGLSIALGGRTILDHVDMTVSGGEIVTVIGPNGAGKSTLVKILLGLLKPDAGSVGRAPGLTVGYVPQRFPLENLVPLTVERLVTMTVRASRAAVTAALEETGIPHLRDADAAGLSGGEFQRALIARALLRDPDLLVLDEPVQGVDFTGETKLYRLIGEIRDRRGCGVVLISHDLHVVMAESDRVICLNGHVCCEGVPETIRTDPEFMRLFGPAAARHLAIYPHAHDHDHGHDHEHDHGERAAS